MQTNQYVGIYPRMLAHNIDLVLLLPSWYLIGTFIRTNYLLLACCWILYVLYHILFECSPWRGTPGKRFQRLEVVDASLSPTTTQQIILRNLTKILSVLPLFAGVIAIAVDSKRRALHDRLANTLVIFS